MNNIPAGIITGPVSDEAATVPVDDGEYFGPFAAGVAWWAFLAVVAAVIVAVVVWL